MAVRDDFTAGEVLSADDLNDTFASKLDLAGGKILQIVRATDSTNRSTTSSSFVDASISVTITPQKSDSAIILIWSARFRQDNAGVGILLNAQITDNSNNAISGAEELRHSGTAYNNGTLTIGSILIGYSTPATTSATTYKGRFNATAGTFVLQNADQTGQLYAIEVSA